ncbi:MAG: hypothetical protein ACE5ES_03500 [Candidatus Nanoarchaeia archaeon]
MKFREIIQNNLKKYRFVIVCGGGSVARKYISALKESKATYKEQSMTGILATRINAQFMSYFFNQDLKTKIPSSMEEVKKQAKKSNLIFCGALGYKPKQTTDSTASEISAEFKTYFINITNVDGLHDKNPKKFKKVKFIPKISWKDFYQMANKMSFKPGQHFVLDQTSAKIIMKNKTTAYILGKNMKQLDNLLRGKKFKGTLIKG